MSSKVIAGRYELIEKIGDGGMAVVYKAKCRLLNRMVAVKILKPEYTKDAKFIENFRKESHAAASLSHPNIVSIYDVGKEGNINYIVMELVEGETLNEIIKRRAPLNYKEVIDFTKQIAAGLSAAHKHGIVHRDVKPHNILVNGDGIAKIADFGIAKAATTTTIMDTTSETIMGSVHYFSPEQARGAYVDERSDIYSLGIVMYEMLTGKVPFDGENPVAVALMHINENVQSPSLLVDGIPPSLEKIVMKATDKYQTNRFKSADEMIDALNNLELVTRVVGNSVFAATTPVKVQKDNNDYIDDYDEQAKEIKKENKKRKNATRKNRKKLIILIAIIVAILAAGVGIGFATGLFGKADISVPNVKGMTYDEAKDALESKKLKIKKGDYVYNSKYNQDEVVSQDPKAKEKVRKGTTVTVDISKGKEEGIVPNLIGKTEEEAKDLIERNGFKLGTVETKTDTAKEGTVIEQDPGAGATAEPKATVNIVLSDGKGKEAVEVPNLVGLSLSQAKAAITTAGFEVGKISYSSSETYSKDTVMEQQYATGTELEKGESINITVSKGSESSTIDLYIDFSSAKEEIFYLTVTVSDDQGTRNIVSNKRKSKSDGGENIGISGTGNGTITVIFDNEVIMKKKADFTTGNLS